MTFLISFSTSLESIRELPVESDWHALNYIRAKYYTWDKELYSTKWFDYRQMTPLQATAAYANAYETVYRGFFAETLNFEKAKYIKFLPIAKISERMELPDIKNPKNAKERQNNKQRLKARETFSAFWRGRQIADALGMPYETYIDAVITKRLRNWRNRYLPRPIHLYRDIEVEYAQERWEELQASRLFLANHPVYLNQNYQNLPQQNDYHEWLFKQAELRSEPSRFLARFVSEGRLLEEKVRNRIADNEFRLRKFDDALHEFHQHD